MFEFTGCVITSYSIHYTKLYDAGSSPAPVSTPAPAATPVSAPTAAPVTPVVEGGTKVTAPMPGNILDVKVMVGVIT